MNDPPSSSFLDLLSNSLVLKQLSPYLSISSALALTATCKSARSILYDAPDTFRYLDLSPVKSAVVPDVAIDHGGINWRSQRMDESLTPSEFLTGPLRGIFSFLEQRSVLRNVQTMILDGLSVTSDFVHEIITDSRYNVRILSIREAPAINERQLRQCLEYVCRPSRPQGCPRLRALYVFGGKSKRPPSTNTSVKERKVPRPPTTDEGVTSSDGAQLGASWNEKSQEGLNASLTRCEDRWYQRTGRMFKRDPDPAWGYTLKACEGMIAFDAVLCRGPRHDMGNLKACESSDYPSIESFLPPMVTTVALGPSGCVKCGSIPEKPAIYENSPPHHLPLLDPPPLHASTVEQAQRPNLLDPSPYPPLITRCSSCVSDRFCERCLKFWDERCYFGNLKGARTNEVRDDFGFESRPCPTERGVKVQMGLCTESCLVSEMMHGAGSFGMWG